MIYYLPTATNFLLHFCVGWVGGVQVITTLDLGQTYQHFSLLVYQLIFGITEISRASELIEKKNDIKRDICLSHSLLNLINLINSLYQYSKYTAIYFAVKSEYFLL